MTIRRPYNLFDELLHDAAPGFFIRPLHGDGLPAASQIRLDVAQSADAYTIHAELPGVETSGSGSGQSTSGQSTSGQSTSGGST